MKGLSWLVMLVSWLFSQLLLETPFFYSERFFMISNDWLAGYSLSSYTVTRLDMIFRYPDRVPLTHFVHRAKKVYGMWAWIFCWVYCATGIFRRCNGKVFKHRVGANLRPSDYEPGVLPLRHCTLVCKMQWHSFCSLLGFSSRSCSYRKPNFPAVSGMQW
jgi:hypothetical protein